MSRKTLYKKHNLELWHPKFDPNIQPAPLAAAPSQETPEPQSEQGCLPEASETRETAPERSPEPLAEQGSFQSLYYEGFEDPITPDGATVALPPQGQRAAKVAHPKSDISPPSSGISNWAELKASLPPRLQAKITQKQRQLSLLEPDRSSPQPELRAVTSSDPPVLCEPVALSPREPTESERREFEEWYPLAQAFGLVSDYEWQFREYFVLSQGNWLPYNELSSDFSVSCLRRYLDTRS